MKYDLDYQGATEILEDRLSTGVQPMDSIGDSASR